MKLWAKTVLLALAQLGKNMEPQKDFILTLTLTVEEANTILSALQELPAKVSNPLTNKLVKQAQEQLPKEETKDV
jgi:hypothetical protein